MHSYEQMLDQAAELWGIEPEYWDIWRRRHPTSADTKRAILRGLGVDADSLEGLQRSLERHRRAEALRLFPPVLVVGEQGESFCPIRLPLESAASRLQAEIATEDGQVFAFEIPFGDLPDTRTWQIDGRGYVERLVRLPDGLPRGYHEMTVRLPSGASSMRLIVTPERAWQPEFIRGGGKAAGIAVSLYGVRSTRNWGVGDFGDLYQIVDWTAADLGASFIALNPLHAIHNRRPFNTSPYLPNCIFYQNAIYLDIEAIEDFRNSERAQRCWQSAAVQAEVRELRGSEHVEYERVNALKQRVLKLAFGTFLRREFRRDTVRAREFRDFVAGEGELLERFAVYSALDEYLHRNDPNVWVWTQWPEPFQDPDSRETMDFRDRHWRSVMFYQYLQWQIDRQLAAVHNYAQSKLAIGLYHDLALATDRFGSDLWAYRDFFASGCRVGSPPDDFSPSGQDWGFPPPNSHRHLEDGYRLFSQSIRKNCRHGGALRIDHVMRFFRLYWIPDGIDAASGAYVRDRAEDLVRILALESVRNRVLVVGEDLGTVEPIVRKTLAEFGVFSYRLLYFEKHENGDFKAALEYPRQALVSSTTHDLPTLAGFWTGEDIRARLNAGAIDQTDYERQFEARQQEKQRLLDLLFQHGLVPGHYTHTARDVPDWTGELHNAAVGFLASTPSQLLAINQEDLTKEVYQQNLPGTTWQCPNWGRKMRFTVEELSSHPQARDYTRMFRHWLDQTGRSR
jgi:4-alpha-glucanotransferase